MISCNNTVLIILCILTLTLGSESPLAFMCVFKVAFETHPCSILPFRLVISTIPLCGSNMYVAAPDSSVCTFEDSSNC